MMKGERICNIIGNNECLGRFNALSIDYIEKAYSICVDGYIGTVELQLVLPVYNH